MTALCERRQIALFNRTTAASASAAVSNARYATNREPLRHRGEPSQVQLRGCQRPADQVRDAGFVRAFDAHRVVVGTFLKAQLGGGRRLRVAMQRCDVQIAPPLLGQ